jgi:hypothetical protein
MNQVKVNNLVFEAILFLFAFQSKFSPSASTFFIVITFLRFLFLFDVFGTKDSGLSVPEARNWGQVEVTQVHINRLDGRGVT